MSLATRRVCGTLPSLMTRPFHSLPNKPEEIAPIKKIIEKSAFWSPSLQTSTVCNLGAERYIYVNMEEAEKGREILEKALGYHPTNLPKATHEASLTLALGNQDEALKLMAVARCLDLCDLTSHRQIEDPHGIGKMLGIEPPPLIADGCVATSPRKSSPQTCFL